MSFIDNLKVFCDQHSQDILTGCAVAGLGICVYLAGKAGVKIADTIYEAKVELDESDPTEEEVKEIKVEATKKVIKYALPTAIAVIFTGTCIISSNRISASKQAAFAGIASSSLATTIDYRKKAREIFGKKKAAELDHEVCRDQVNDDTVIKTGRGTDLICEGITGQVIENDINYVRTKWNDICARLNDGEDVPLNDWLYDIGAELSSIGNQIIFNLDPDKDRRMIHLEETTMLTKNGKACIYLMYDHDPLMCA